MFINHSRCPDCGKPVKSYYYYCKCGNSDLTNWSLTGYVVGGFLIFAAIVMYFMLSRICNGGTLFSMFQLCEYFK